MSMPVHMTSDTEFFFKQNNLCSCNFSGGLNLCKSRFVTLQMQPQYKYCLTE